MDEDGFLDGEMLDGRRGLVPSNYVTKLVGADLLAFHRRLTEQLGGRSGAAATGGGRSGADTGTVGRRGAGTRRPTEERVEEAPPRHRIREWEGGVSEGAG